MPNELKTCPFCGAIPVLEYGNVIQKWWYTCGNEKCLVQPTTYAYKTKGGAKRAWNKRMTTTDRDMLIELLDQKQHQGLSTETGVNYISNLELADHLLANGVIVQTCTVKECKRNVR